MDLQLVIFLIVIVLFAISGYRSGFLQVLSRLVSLPAAYLVAILFSKPFAHWLQQTTALQGIIVYLIAGTTLFFVTITVLLFLFWLVRRALAQTHPTISSQSAIAGALLSGLFGIAVGLLAVWFSSTIQTLWQSKQGKSHSPGQFTQSVNNLVGKTMGSVTRQLSKEDNLSQATAVLLANPAENIERLQRINEKGVVQNLFYDQRVRDALETHNAALVMQTPAFQALANQADFAALAKELTGAGANADSDINQQMAIKITSVWAQINAVKNDPKFIALTQDPEVAAMMRAGNLYQMMKSAKIESLLNIISAVEAPQIIFDPLASESQKPNAAKPTIYRWVDENGKVHYSDKKPKTDN